MKSFFQLAEHIRYTKRHKLREADGDLPAPKEAESASAVANQQNQNNQDLQNTPDQKSDPRGVAPAEIPDVDLVDDFHKKLENLVKDKANAAALVKMKEIQQTTDFTSQLTNALAELQKALTELKDKDKQEKEGSQNGGSNSTGSGAGASPAPPAPMPPAPPAGTTQQ